MTDSPLPGTGTSTLAEVVDGVLFDLDGVVYRGANAVEHAPEAINALSVRTRFVTNNASRSPADVAAHLTALGVNAQAADVTTSAQAAASLVRHIHGRGARVLMVGGAGLRWALEEESLVVVGGADDGPEVVVQGTSTEIRWVDLAEAVYAINSGADFIATNMDSTMPTERGMALGNGALVRAVAHATGVEPSRAAGKPSPEIFTHAARAGGMRHALVVGDRVDTDIRGARSAGIDSLVVFTGVADPRAVLGAEPRDRPTYLARDLRGLHDVHPGAWRRGEEWRCGDALAAVEGEDLVVTAGDRRSLVSGAGAAVEISLDGLRAACAAAWTHPGTLTFERDIHIRA